MAKVRAVPSLLAIVIGFSLATSTTAAAAPAPDVPVPGDTACVSIAAAGDQETGAFTDAVAAAIENGEVRSQVPEDSLDLSGTTVYTVGTQEGTFTTATVPINGGYSLTSNFSVVFDSAGDVARYGETLVSENEVGNFAVTNYSDGVLVSDQDTDLAFLSDAALEADLANARADVRAQAAEQDPGACIAAVLGVSGVVGGIIAYTCAGACAAAAAGVGVPFCVACIAGITTIGGASITAVASCFA